MIIKLAGLTQDLETIVQELDFASLSLPEATDPSHDKAVLEVLKSQPAFEKILNYWITASKMRIWLNGKKQSVISRLTSSE